MMASGTKIANSAAIQMIASVSGSATGPPSMRPRAASITDVTGDPFASFLLGQVQASNQTIPVFTAFRETYTAGFINDEFKVSDKLTLTLGLRFDYQSARTEKDNQYSTFSPTTPNPGAGGIPGAIIFAGDGAGRSGQTKFEDVPKDGPAVLVCNHVSFVDALVIAAACRRPVRFVMDHAIFKMPVLSFVFRTGRAIPIASGVWKLHFFDWYVGIDSGSIAGWELCFDAHPITVDDCQVAPTVTVGCNSVASFTGTPSATSASAFTIDFASLNGQVNGVVFYGVNGQVANIWALGSSSFLCVKTPVQRMPSQSSGGTAGACNGSFTEDWNAYMSSHPAALGQPLAAGQVINAQAWYRDPPAPGTTNLSGGLQFTVCN